MLLSSVPRIKVKSVDPVIVASRPESSSPVLFVADLFHPIDILAVRRFLNSDGRHRRRRRCAMPMLQAKRKPDYITGPNFLDRAALTLNPAQARDDDQCLAERMRMPGGAGARLECDAATADTRRIRRLEQRVDPDDAGEIFGRSRPGRLRTVSFDFHYSIPSLYRDTCRIRGGRSDCCERDATCDGEQPSAGDHGVSCTLPA